MDGLIPITNLNDFLFCPYSIYLHGVYHGAEGETVKATVQNKGTLTHQKENSEKRSQQGVITELPVISEKIGIQGVIDSLDTLTGTLTEYKNHLKGPFKGQIIQIQAQALCLHEMGYEVKIARLLVLSDRHVIEVPLPSRAEKKEITKLVKKIKAYNPEDEIPVNINKCKKCIYCALCEKSEMTNDF